MSIYRRYVRWIEHCIGAIRLAAATFVLIGAFPAAPAVAQTPVSTRDPIWLQEAKRHWYDEQIVQGKPSPMLLFGLKERNNPGSYGLSSLGEMERLFATNPRDPDEIDWKAMERKAVLALPLLRSGNGFPLLFRPQKDLYATYAKRLAGKPWDRMPRIKVPDGAVAVDTHVHTCYSHDSLADPAEMVKAGAHCGLSGMAITDHDTMTGAREALEALPKLIRQGKVPPTFFVIPGEEVSSSDGHIIGLYLTREIAPGMSAERTVGLIHEQGGIAIAAHPEIRDGLGKLAAALPFDAIETENTAEDLEYAMGGRSSRTRHALYAKVAGPHMGASDAHDPGAVATAYTLIPDCAPNPEAVRAAIQGVRTEPMEPVDRVGNAQQHRLTDSGLPTVLFLMGSLLGSETQGIGAWVKEITHADAASFSLLPHPELYWSKRF